MTASKTNPFKTRIIALMLFCLFLATAVVIRAGWIQVKKDPRLEAMAKRQFSSKILVRPTRGAITDRNGEPLAVNVETNSLAVNPSKVQSRKTLARLLSKCTDIPVGKIMSRLNSKKEFAWIKRHLSEPEMNKLRKWRIIEADGDMPVGLWLVKESKRVYPHGEIAAHVLGSVNLDSEGLEGVELWANERLEGKSTSMNATRDALGRPVLFDPTAAGKLKDGEGVALTLDASLQYSVEQELRNAVTRTKAKGGSVIVMDSTTGEILAMANEPSFNPNDKTASPARRRNRVLTDGYEPGSTMKAVLLASALSKGMKLTDTVHGENGTFLVQGKRISEAEAHEKFQFINLKKVIQVSSNVGSAKIALKIGATQYHSTLKAFGFGTKTGTGFPGEISGRVMPLKDMTPLALANIGFGQGILVTPIQMLRAYATFANGGMLVQPTLLKSETPPPAPVRVITEKVAHNVTEALQAVTVEGGTGLKAVVEGYKVAGKTGTAQAVDPNTGRYSRSRYIASFIGFPVDVNPKLVIYTMIDEPKGVYYAGETAAPLFRAVLNAAATRYSLPAQDDPARVLAAASPQQKNLNGTVKTATVVKTALDSKKDGRVGLADRLQWSLAKVTDAGPTPDGRLEVHGNGLDGNVAWTMPDVVGLSPREAVRALQGHRFNLELNGNGLVKTQAPHAGNSIADGGTVRLNLVEP